MSDEEYNVQEELEKSLEKIFDDDDFIIGVISNAEHIEDRRRIIEMIKNGKLNTKDDILVMPVYLDNVRNGME